MALSLYSKSYLSSKSLSRLFALRFQSTLPSHPNHTDLSDDSSPSATTDPLLQKLEEAVHRIIVRRAAPDWLPFLPGSSYWVPPPRSADGYNRIAQLVEKLANPLTDEETLSTTTVRGWPSSDYFIKGGSLRSTNMKTSPTKLEAAASSTKPEAKASSNKSKAVATSSNESKSEDEEG